MTITGKATIAGVMGWPVGHSRSPRLHNFWLARAGIDGAYIPFAVPPERVEAALRALPALGFAGTNVTIPHKEAVFAAVDETDAIARRIGAVNTVFAPRRRYAGGHQHRRVRLRRSPPHPSRRLVGRGRDGDRSRCGRGGARHNRRASG